MKRHLVLYVPIFTLLFAALASAQVRPPVPRASQKATVLQTVGTTDISVQYSRPVVKGRTIWGDPPTGTPAGEATLDDGRARPAGSPIVYWGKVWRTGANEATLFTVTDDVIINGQPLPAGKYSLHSIPGKDDWTFIFNKDDGQWGSFSYDAKKDAIRVKSKPQWTTDSQEALWFGIEPTGENSAKVVLRWEKLSVPFTVEVKDVVGSTMTRLNAYVAAAKADDPAPYANAGAYAKANKQTAEATKWFEEALKRTDAQLAAKETFQNLQRRSNILFQLDRKQESLAAAEKAVAVGKADPNNKAAVEALEKRIADIKAGKQ